MKLDMDKLNLNTSLTPGQAAFALMLEKTPYLKPLWNLERREYDQELVERYLGTASHGQAIMARFMLAVWRHNNYYDFDLIEAASVLDRENMAVIQEWLANPIWP